ncbi:MAG: 5'/3'-nucleotidase SurE [Isosphaeraceae bacterium]
MKGAGSRVFLLTNDDGIDAPGLQALTSAIEGLGRARVVAPVGQYSNCGHSVTTHRPLLIDRRPDGRIAVDGSPADCVRVALHHLEPALDWVVSGINAGGNLGSDVHYSGTVAAAREAVLHGRPAIAVSHYVARGREIDWPSAARWTRRVLDELVARPWEPGTLWSVNLPHPEKADLEPEIVFCPLDPSPLPLTFRIVEDGRRAEYAGNYHGRPRVAGADVETCLGGRIAVTLLRVTPV